MQRARLRVWRVLVAVLVVAAGLVVGSVATTSSAQTAVPATDSSVVDASGATVSSTPTVTRFAGRDTPTGRAIAALVGSDPVSASTLVPPGFAAAMGYLPVMDDGVPANPDGGCSSPLAPPAAFDAPWKAHDLGYDLLRYSAMVGSTQGPWAREALDAQLVRRVEATCEPGDGGCHTAAELVRAGVSANSHRQSEGVPGVETPMQIATSIVRLAWVPVARAAGALGTPAGRAVAAALLAWALVAVWRNSRHGFVVPPMPTVPPLPPLPPMPRVSPTRGTAPTTET